MKVIYQNAIEKSITYDAYRTVIDELILQNKSTGHDQSELVVDFTKLNQQRMKRLDKTLVLEKNTIDAIKAIEKKQVWLLLTESWCGDAAQNVPILNKIAAINNLIDLRIVLRDDNDELMQRYLTNGGKSIPKLISVSEDLESELFTWGPRPEEAVQLVVNLKSKYGGITEEVKEALQKWYNEDKGFSLQNEIITLLK